MNACPMDRMSTTVAAALAACPSLADARLVALDYSEQRDAVDLTVRLASVEPAYRWVRSVGVLEEAAATISISSLDGLVLRRAAEGVERWSILLPRGDRLFVVVRDR